MREIKFRFWGTFDGDESPCMMYGDRFAYAEYGVINDQLNSGQETAMQYTGLKDKNGTEIYEGDIFHLGDPDFRYEIIYEHHRFVGKIIGTQRTSSLMNWVHSIRVMGNIYEDSELLKQQ